MKLITSAIERTNIKKLKFEKAIIKEENEFTPENSNNIVEFLSPMVLVLELMFKNNK